jgi:transcriptional regulator with XRE-family HTH domain
MNRPPEQQPPPYGALIEAAREAAGLSRREAARRAGISDAWWRYVVQGWQNGPISGASDTVAKMARVVGVTPEQLETEGNRSDAARVLRESLSAGAPAAPRDLPAAGARGDDDPVDDAAARLFPGDTRHDRLIRNIWRYGADLEERLELIEVVDPKLAAALRDVRGQSEAGLRRAVRSHVRLPLHGNDSDTLRVSGRHRTVFVRHA